MVLLYRFPFLSFVSSGFCVVGVTVAFGVVLMYWSSVGRLVLSVWGWTRCRWVGALVWIFLVLVCRIHVAA